MNAHVKCPCCGGEMESQAMVQWLCEIPMSYFCKAILERLVAAHPKRVDIDELIFAAYGKAAREPEYPESVVKVSLKRIREAIEPHGWTVSRNRGGRGCIGHYRLEPVR